MTDLTHAEIRILLSENQRLTEELTNTQHDLEHLESYVKTIEVHELELIKEIAALKIFIGKVQGTCLGVAMSDCHPNPDGALMALVNEAQDILFPPKEDEEETAA